MCIDAINAEDGQNMGALKVDPSNMPRRGDVVVMGEKNWFVESVVWTGDPGKLKPTAIRLSPTIRQRPSRESKRRSVECGRSSINHLTNGCRSQVRRHQSTHRPRRAKTMCATFCVPTSTLLARSASTS